MDSQICTAHWLPLTAVAWDAFCASMAAGLLLRTAYDAAHPLVIGEFAEDNRHAAQWLAICSCAMTAFALFLLALGMPQPGSGIFAVLLEAMPITMSLAAIVLIIRYVIRLVFQPPRAASLDDGANRRLGQDAGLDWRVDWRLFARANGVAVAIGLVMLLPTLWSLQLPGLCR